MKKLLTYGLTAIIFLLIGMLMADTKVAEVARKSARSASSAAIEVVANKADIDTRTMVLAENPEMISRIVEGGAFGGAYSMAAATNMFGRTEDAIEVGGETFVLQHHKGETGDQLYVWVPGRGALASADYYQGFLPNAGNGKRYQRHVEDWVVALREMAALQPQVLLPAHGEAITDTDTIVENFSVLADALQYIVDYTIEGFNAGKRKDVIYRSVKLPEHLAKHPSLNVQYVTVNDISKMIIKKYTGWWYDIPSNWSPASMEDQGDMIIELAGGNIPTIVDYARGLISKDIRLASHLTDWLFYARPDNTEVQQLVFAVYKARILDPDTNTMEMLTYLDQMTAARERTRGGK